MTQHVWKLRNKVTGELSTKTFTSRARARKAKRSTKFTVVRVPVGQGFTKPVTIKKGATTPYKFGSSTKIEPNRVGKSLSQARPVYVRV